MKVYIAGPMSGLAEFNRPEFMLSAARLSHAGNIVLNPATLPDGLSQREYMDICTAMLRCADTIYMLKGWANSSGARAELALAEKLELGIVFQCEGDKS